MDAAYRSARLRNTLTGDRQDVVLFDPQNEANEDLLSSEFSIELKTDLKRALSTFSVLEQRIIVRVLLQGQSIREATRRMKASHTAQKTWLREVALPKLRTLLADYAEELAKHGATLPCPVPEVNEEKHSHDAKCKFCNHLAISTKSADAAFNLLKKHVAEKHPEAYKPVRQFVANRDYEIYRLADAVREAPQAEIEEDC